MRCNCSTVIMKGKAVKHSYLECKWQIDLSLLLLLKNFVQMHFRYCHILFHICYGYYYRYNCYYHYCNYYYYHCHYHYSYCYDAKNCLSKHHYHEHVQCSFIVIPDVVAHAFVEYVPWVHHDTHVKLWHIHYGDLFYVQKENRYYCYYYSCYCYYHNCYLLTSLYDLCYF